MKSLTFYPFTLIIVFLIIFTGIMLYINNYPGENKINSQDVNENYRYHFVIIAQNTDDPFWLDVKKGAMKAAKESNVVIEFNGPRFINLEEQLKWLDIAIASQVDGIITHVSDSSRYTPLINKAVDMGIPVVTLEGDAKNSKRYSFIGTNNFKVGREASSLVMKAVRGQANVAVILNNYSDQGKNVLENLRITGFKDGISGNSSIEIKTIQSSQMGIFSAEEVTEDIIRNYPDINVIWCNSSKDTIGAAQVVVDFNKVGEIVIIGYGDLPEILRYVEKDVIYGTIVSNPLQMGYSSIKSLVEIKEDNMTSSYVDTGVEVITSEDMK